ncbi:MAG: VWA domain-containing protein [Planctomycetota bacterium]
MTKASFFGFGWLRPDFAVWAVAGIVILLLGFWAVHRRALAVDSLVSQRQKSKFVPRLSLNRARARFVLAGLAVSFLALAVSGPVRGFTLREIRRRGLDLVVCIDTSRSMLVRDLRPDRITRARREVNGLIERLRGDRMALIAFAGDAREVAPLTHDRNALSSLLENVNPAENEKGGTDLGAALERALAMFDGRTGAHEGIVMLTDGEDLEGHGLEVARKAAERGVKVFVVGMGTEAGGKIPVERQGGGETFLRDANNQEVVSAMGGRGLEELASTTGGAYLSADSSAAPLEELYEKRISRLEAREVQGGQEFVPHDRFQWFLGLAAICMLGAAGLRERRVRARKRVVRGRRIRRVGGTLVETDPRARPVWARALAPLLCLPGLQAPQVPGGAPVPPGAPVAQAEVPAPAVTAYAGSVRRGLEELRAALEAKQLEAARGLGDALLAKPELTDALRAEIEYHRGVVAEACGDPGGSAAAFGRAGGLAAPGNLRLDAWYNAGAVDLNVAEQLYLQIPEVREARKLPALAPASSVAPGPQANQPAPAAPKNQDLDQAAAAYKVARGDLTLRLRADWHDADTRANLELIQRRLQALEKLRKEREEQEKKDQEQQDPKQDKDKDPKQDDKQKDKNDPSKQDDKSDGKKPEDDKQKQPEDKPADKPEEKPPQAKPEDAQGKDPKSDKQAKPAEEKELSKEQVSRLMDQLQAIDKEARELQARIRAHRRAQVPKDW